jgi:fermentation-respiration switch protein FrsA (DUF1100 family)
MFGVISVLLGVAGIAGFLAAVFFFAGPSVICRIIIRRGRTMEFPRASAAKREIPWLDTVKTEEVKIKSRDGLVLSARYLAAPGSPDTAILAHGYRGNAKQMSPFARIFYEDLGCNVLLPDARAHGASDGTWIGFGWPERLDYLGWIDWVKARPGETGGEGPVEARTRIVLFGISMGAATVMMTAGENPPPEVKAVIEDCGYTSAEEEIRHHLGTVYHIRSRWLIRALNRKSREIAGYGFNEASAAGQIKKTKLPVLFIHGEADNFVPFGMVHALYEACSGEKELFTVKDAGHGFSYNVSPGEYKNRVTAFVRKHLP